MTPLEVIRAKRVHLDRLANQSGADGEASALTAADHWIPRPRGPALQALLAALAETGVSIKGSSFDAIAFAGQLDFRDRTALKAAVPAMTFIEIKTASQGRVRPGFGGFFFALTESEIAAADALGERHRVALYNRASGELLLTSVPQILARARSTTWQLSVQL